MQHVKIWCKCRKGMGCIGQKCPKCGTVIERPKPEDGNMEVFLRALGVIL